MSIEFTEVKKKTLTIQIVDDSDTACISIAKALIHELETKHSKYAEKGVYSYARLGIQCVMADNSLFKGTVIHEHPDEKKPQLEIDREEADYTGPDAIEKIIPLITSKLKS